LTRRGTDVVLLAPAVVALWAAIVSYPPRRVERALERLLDTFPGLLGRAWELLASTRWGFFACPGCSGVFVMPWHRWAP
jgi:hypothetical protein